MKKKKKVTVSRLFLKQLNALSPEEQQALIEVIKQIASGEIEGKPIDRCKLTEEELKSLGEEEIPFDLENN